MIVYVFLFIKNLFQREKFVLFNNKNKNKIKQKTHKTQKNNILVGFLGGFLVGFCIANPA
jgi:hypothetical protein